MCIVSPSLHMLYYGIYKTTEAFTPPAAAQTIYPAVDQLNPGNVPPTTTTAPKPTTTTKSTTTKSTTTKGELFLIVPLL
jgi:hypothetical protein